MNPSPVILLLDGGVGGEENLNWYKLATMKCVPVRLAEKFWRITLSRSLVDFIDAMADRKVPAASDGNGRPDRGLPIQNLAAGSQGIRFIQSFESSLKVVWLQGSGSMVWK